MQSRIAGAPIWVNSDRFDVAAKAESDPPVDGIRAMLRSLLEDRFQLKSHWAMKKGAMYELVVSKPGKLKQTSGDCGDFLSEQAFGTNAPSDAPCGGSRNTPGGAKGYRVTADGLAQSLAYFLQRSVVDKTGLAGRYDVELVWAPDPGDDGRPSLFTAVEEQLGLKLKSAKGPLRMLVVDHVARPSAD